MRKCSILLFSGALVMALTVACQPLIVPVTPTAATPQGTTEATITTLTDTVTVSSTDTVVETVTETVTSSEVNTKTVAVAETATLTPTVEPSTATTEPRLTVVVASLRIRSGPGTAYTILGTAVQGESYPIRGQANGCQWYQVTHPQFVEAWMAGGAQYTATDTPCAQIAEAAIPILPTAAPAPTVAPVATPVPAQESQANNPEPAPTEPPTQPVEDPFPADQGCLLLQNQLGPELTFTFTRANDSWNAIVKVSSDQDVPYCLAPGRYRVTVDAPPPWSSINEEFDIKAGDRAYFPIRPQ